MDKNNLGVTAEIKIKRCYGCGAILQSDNPKQSGYLTKEKLSEEGDKLCQRCYKLRHYGEDKEVIPSFNDDYIKLLDEAVKSQSLIVFVLDAFTYDGGFVKEFYQYLANRCLVVVNKEDILPRDFPSDKLISRIKTTLEANSVNPLDYLLISSSKNTNMDLLMEKINYYRQGRDVYFIGVNNVGKSSIVNKILKNYKNTTNKLVTTSNYPGTTLGVIKIPMDNDSYMYDTPGIFNPNSMTNQVEKDILKFIIPRSQINVKHFQLDDERSLLIGGLARFDLFNKNDKKKSSVTLLFSNDVEIENCKLAKADNTFISQIIQKQTTPISARVREIKDLVKKEYILPQTNGDETVLISIMGYGFIMLQPKGQTIAVYAPQQVEVNLELVNYRA